MMRDGIKDILQVQVDHPTEHTFIRIIIDVISHCKDAGFGAFDGVGGVRMC